jgi:lysophospholipase L1-like esterase
MTKRTFLVLLALISAHAFPQSRRQTRPHVVGGFENGEALAPFLDALEHLRTGRRREPVRILHFGDSHVAADILTAEIRKRFQNEYGNGGAGFILPGNPFSTPRRDARSGLSTGWRFEGIGRGGVRDGMYGLMGVSLSTELSGASLWVEAACSHFEILFLEQPNGGAMSLLVDGKSIGRPISLKAPRPSLGSLTIDVGVNEIHRLEIHVAGGGEVRIFGVVAERNETGVVYDVLGINGARASRILGWNQSLFLKSVALRKPDLIILAYGTNEVTDSDWTVASYVVELKEIIKGLMRAVPEASIIISGPPDRSVREGADWRAAPRLSQLFNAERKAALACDAAFWNGSAAMGGPGSMNLWFSRGLAQPDRVHLTRAGYLLLADRFFDDLISLPSVREPSAPVAASTAETRCGYPHSAAP